MKKLFLLFLLLSASFLIWKGYEAYSIQRATESAAKALAPLLEYRELYESGRSREANDVLLKVVAQLVTYDNQSLEIKEILLKCELINNTPTNYSDLLTESLLRNLKIARELKLDTPENVELMRQGRSPIVGAGPYEGEKAEVDHIIPKALAADLDNLLINLELMPMTLNRRKSDKVTQRAAQMAKKFYESGVMMGESYQRVIQMRSE